MLGLTDRAVATLAYVRRQKGLPDHFGVRIFTRAAPHAKSTFQVGFVEGPEAGDEVGEREGMRVFIAPELAALAGSVLDTRRAPSS